MSEGKAPDAAALAEQQGKLSHVEPAVKSGSGPSDEELAPFG